MSVSIENGKVCVTVSGKVARLTPDQAKELADTLYEAREEIHKAAIVAQNEAFEKGPIPEGVTLIASHDQTNRVDEVIRASGKKTFVYFSAAQVYSYRGGADEYTVMVASILDEVAVEGLVQFIADCEYEADGCEFEYEETYGVRPGYYESPVLENPTWLEVAKAANDMILRTGDHHHRFLEGIKSSHVNSQGVEIYRFDMGS